MAVGTSIEVDEGERVFRELADNLPVKIWRSGTDKLCNWVNKPWLEFVGRTLDQEIGNGWAEDIHPDDVNHCVQTYVASFEGRKLFSMIGRFRRADGTYRYILVNGAPIYRGGNFAGYFGVAVDVTEQRETEERLRQTMRADAIDQLAGGVVHDLKNLLTAISYGVENICRGVTENPDSVDHSRLQQLQQMTRDAVRRAATLISRLLDFSRRQPLDPKPIDVNRLIAGIIEVLKCMLSGNNRLETVLPSGLWLAYADAAELECAIVNLAVNARDAMPDGGTITIETANASPDETAVAQNAGPATPGRYVMIAVTDTGTGMDPATVERAGEPFFTTKESGKGTGLGLSQVCNFAKQSSGQVRIFSQAGHGTCVKLYLPAMTGQAAQAPDDRIDVATACD